MTAILYYLGILLQISGFLTLIYTFILFFGQTGMGTLLKIALLGIAEFYSGTLLRNITGTK